LGSNQTKGVGRRAKVRIFVVVLFIAFGVFACTVQKASRDGITIADSKSYEASLYRQNCLFCHGAEAYGKTVDGKEVPGLRFGDAKKKTRAEIYEQIKHGKLPMPSFENQLTEKEIEGMVDFIMYDLQARERENERGKR
jgi:mono/diheme cytochrome c family protein